MTTDDRGSAAIDETEQPSRSSHVKGRRQRKQLPLWQETILLLAIALGLAIIIKAFFLQAFYIPSESMEPGLVNNDRILVQKMSYWGGGTPQRGDIVVFQDPGGWLTPSESATPGGILPRVMSKIGLYPTGGHLVKRVVGVAGDEIHCCDDQGRLEVNGTPVEESEYVKDKGLRCNGPMVSNCQDDWTAGPVPEGKIFVMGDNRAHSADSTVHMCKVQETECVPGPEFVDTDKVVGKVFVLLWPADHFRWIHRPDGFDDVPSASP